MARRRVVRRSKPAEPAELTESLVKGITEVCGKGAATVMTDYEDAVTSKVKVWVPSGFDWLDAIMSEGRGFPVGKIIEIYGDEGTGKTALSQFIIREFQKRGGVAVYVDFETSMDQTHLKGYGIDLGNLIYVDVETIEEGFDAVMSVIEK